MSLIGQLQNVMKTYQNNMTTQHLIIDDDYGNVVAEDSICYKGIKAAVNAFCLVKTNSVGLKLFPCHRL